MVIAENLGLFSDYLIEGTLLVIPLSWGEQICCLYSSFISFRRGGIPSIDLGTIELRLHWSPRVQVEHLQIADTSLFWYFCCIDLQCFISEPKLNT